MDGTSNSVITQTLDLPIHFPTRETQTLSFFVTLLDQGCMIVLGYRWLTRYNPSIDWVLGNIQFHQTLQPKPKTSPPTETELSSVPLASDIPPMQPPPPVTPRKPRVTLINAAAYSRACKFDGSQCFQLWISLPEVTGCSTATSSVDLTSLPEEYHDFVDVFSKSKAGKLTKHQPYDLKITLDEGTVPPFGPIYSLSQEELAALRKFIDENLATGFIRPS